MELESLFISAGKALWHGVTWPARVMLGIATLVLPAYWTRTLMRPKQRGFLVGQAAYNQRTQREPFRGEAIEELHDALSPAYDQLRLARAWWILEWMPLKQKKGNAVFVTSNQASDFHWMCVIFDVIFSFPSSCSSKDQSRRRA
jgi:hypothetical protein